jgi:hypothetical protein
MPRFGAVISRTSNGRGELSRRGSRVRVKTQMAVKKFLRRTALEMSDSIIESVSQRLTDYNLINNKQFNGDFVK